ncbi:hypothetical protein Mapa_005570 [Marchantia paleacea]|nr:hypothetical protein Mapa_005570 [Marchantia paleacea]
MAMPGTANACLWRGMVCSGLRNPGMPFGRVQVAKCRQQRFYKLQCFAEQGHIGQPKSARANLPFPRKANELSDSRVIQYVQAQVREPEILRNLREETNKMHGSGMQVTPDQGQFLAMLVRLMCAEKCIEVGVFTGYSSLAVALVLPDSGCLVACDRSEASLAVAEKYFKLGGVSHKVNVRLGMAIDTLNELLEHGGAGRYDLAFLDADKRMYPQYYELLLQLVRPGGLVVVDNVLWHGTVADPLVVDKKTQSIRDFNDFLLRDNRIDYNLVSIGDGMSLCRKR